MTTENKPENPLIERGVPLPEPNRKPRGEWTNAFLAMEIGDSVLMPHLKSASEAMPRFYYVARTTGRKFTARKTEAGIRVWRVA